jgi:nicotinamidase-related amidase
MQACVPAAQVLLSACRAAGMLVVHTKEAHKADLSDLHPCKLTRGNLPAGEGLRIGEGGPMGRLLVREEPGNEIIQEVAPVEVSDG